MKQLIVKSLSWSCLRDDAGHQAGRLRPELAPAELDVAARRVDVGVPDELLRQRQVLGLVVEGRDHRGAEVVALDVEAVLLEEPA